MRAPSSTPSPSTSRSACPRGRCASACSAAWACPLLAAAAAAADGARRSRSGKLFDVAASDGEAGHATRHFLINTSIYDALRRVYGGQLRREPDNYHGYSDHRPDLALLVEGTLKVFDLKVFDPISSVPGQTGLRGAYVGFGNTAEAAADAVVGRRRRGVPADGRFDRRTGAGHVLVRDTPSAHPSPATTGLRAPSSRRSAQRPTAAPS